MSTGEEPVGSIRIKLKQKNIQNNRESTLLQLQEIENKLDCFSHI